MHKLFYDLVFFFSIISYRFVYMPQTSWYLKVVQHSIVLISPFLIIATLEFFLLPLAFDSFLKLYSSREVIKSKGIIVTSLSNVFRNSNTYRRKNKLLQKLTKYLTYEFNQEDSFLSIQECKGIEKSKRHRGRAQAPKMNFILFMAQPDFQKWLLGVMSFLPSLGWVVDSTSL